MEILFRRTTHAKTQLGCLSPARLITFLCVCSSTVHFSARDRKRTMEYFRRSLLLIVALSCLLLCANAVSVPGIPNPAISIPDANTSDIVEVSTVYQNASVPPELLKLCKDAENPTLCARTILPSLNGTLDPYEALLTEINVTARYTRRAIGMITTLMAAPNNSKSLADCLSTCKEQYGYILDSVKDTLATISSKDMYGSRVSFSSVISYQQGCEDTFKESPDVDFPFARQSKLIFQLAGNCLAIMEALEAN